MELRHRVVGSQSEWTEALDGGAAKGAEDGAKVVRDAAETALANRVTPWGEAFAPLSPTTIRLSAGEQEVGYMRTGRDGAERFVDTSITRKGKVGIEQREKPSGLAPSSVVKVKGSARVNRVAYIHQFGNPRNRMFDNANPAPIPARPILPLRSPTVVDLPPEMSAAILAAIQGGISQAFERTARAQNPGQRRR